jgi:hypothetical protein
VSATLRRFRPGCGASPAGLGIDFVIGANFYQTAPLIAATVTDAGAGTTRVDGTLHSRPNSFFSIRLFSNPPGDEGRAFHGGPLRIATDAAGDANFTFTPGPPIAVGRTVTATATDGDARRASITSNSASARRSKPA